MFPTHSRLPLATLSGGSDAKEARGGGGPAEAAFWRHLRRLRLERKLSQEALAELAGCDRGYIGLLEHGVNSPSLTMVLQLAAALRVAPSRLVALAAAEVGAEPPSQE